MTNTTLRLPNHGTVVDGVRLAPSDAEWAPVEKVVGRPLSTAERALLCEHLEWYFLYLQQEQKSPTLKAATARIKEIRKHAAALTDLLTPRADTLARHVCDAIDNALQDGATDTGYHQELGQAQNAVKRLIVASIIAGRQLEEFSTKKLPREAWNRLIFGLAGTFEQWGGEATARRDFLRQPTPEGLPSPFVALVRAILNMVPEEYRRGTHSWDALSKQVSIALGDRAAVLKSRVASQE